MCASTVENHIIICEWNHRTRAIIKELRADTQTHNTPLIDLERYYDGTCVEPLPPSPPYVPDDTVSSYFHKKVVEIMENIYNTGYAHNADHNFSLLPDYTELKTTVPGTTEFNLFLDCSGFVGYYVIQGLADKLYRDATPSNYICQDRSQ